MFKGSACTCECRSNIVSSCGSDYVGIGIYLHGVFLNRYSTNYMDERTVFTNMFFTNFPRLSEMLHSVKASAYSD